ncbi:MAG: ribosome biogenesis GTPase Der, partial [Caldithrix sp.]|nr:ribosome biogenesis GTPase Der [Caldithrix sp.]
MSEPIVAIVGRPNVGKSTLFNRFIGYRKAIVDDQPGVTRDRNYGQVEWAGQSFNLIDTGGYLPASHEKMEQAVLEQVDLAIQEADLVLLVCDAHTGPTDIDELMAERLLKAKNECLLIVNKVDNEQYDSETGTFYKLGLGRPFAISANSGRASGDVLDTIIKRIKKYQYRDSSKDIIKLAVVGRENAGKSSLVNQLLSEERSIVTEIPGTTRDSIDSLLKFNKQSYMLIDTAGLKKKSRIKENVLFYSNLRTLRSIDRADVVIYMVDMKQGL